MRAAGDIEKRTYGGLYCTACEGFWKERDLRRREVPATTASSRAGIEEENYYFLL